VNDYDLFQIQKTLRDNGLLITFSGKFTQAIIEELGEAVKKYLELEEKPQSDIYNLFSVFIEQTQNIKNYCNDKKGKESYQQIANSGIVTIGKTEKGNYVCSGNLVENTDSHKLTEIIDGIKQLDKKGLKQLYKEILKKDVPPESLGAGIGLVDMARKSSLPLEYSLTKVDDHFVFFSLKAVI
jgi:hypothetical protein